LPSKSSWVPIIWHEKKKSTTTNVYLYVLLFQYVYLYVLLFQVHLKCAGLKNNTWMLIQIPRGSLIKVEFVRGLTISTLTASCLTHKSPQYSSIAQRLNITDKNKKRIFIPNTQSLHLTSTQHFKFEWSNIYTRNLQLLNSTCTAIEILRQDCKWENLIGRI
jgi:hypothetical protein